MHRKEAVNSEETTCENLTLRVYAPSTKFTKTETEEMSSNLEKTTSIID